ncbi:MAG: RNA-binding S4 domain-containing protein [Chthoniobacteraceae bacterium]
MRLDQWLWALRVYKTRTRATEAIKGGHVKVGGAPVKPAHEVKPGQEITARTDALTRTLRVTGMPPSRVGARLVADFAEDLTPPEEYARQKEIALHTEGIRPKGLGRPTKRERRRMEEWDHDDF